MEGSAVLRARWTEPSRVQDTPYGNGQPRAPQRVSRGLNGRGAGALVPGESLWADGAECPEPAFRWENQRADVLCSLVAQKEGDSRGKVLVYGGLYS